MSERMKRLDDNSMIGYRRCRDIAQWGVGGVRCHCHGHGEEGFCRRLGGKQAEQEKNWNWKKAAMITFHFFRMSIVSST